MTNDKFTFGNNDAEGEPGPVVIGDNPNDSAVEKAAEEYCPDRVVSLPNGEPLNVIHAKKIGFKAGVNWCLNHHDAVLRLAEAARVVIAENDSLKGWDDLHDAWYAFQEARKAGE